MHKKVKEEILLFSKAELQLGQLANCDGFPLNSLDIIDNDLL